MLANVNTDHITSKTRSALFLIATFLIGPKSVILAIDGRQADDERRHALLRLVCPAPSCLFSRADTFSAVQLANQCMRSETEVRDPNKLLRSHYLLFVYITLSVLLLSVYHTVCLPVVASFE